ncbi:MAG: hypothetical protein GQ553_02590 [Nitrosomonadaceae bacterium]|nr:hypothetical protein [Nitrosomonadaceae bacterium]
MTSKYRGVSKDARAVRLKWHARYHNRKVGRTWKTWHATEREAALAYDKKMIELGKPPVNILKPVE